MLVFLNRLLTLTKAYFLRSTGLDSSLALSITYSPGKGKLHAVFFGLSPKRIDVIHERLTFAGVGCLEPFALISVFLDLERMQRFEDVNLQDTRMYSIIENFSVKVENGAPAGLSTLDDDDPNGVVRISRGVSHLKNQLELWKAELGKLHKNAMTNFQASMKDPWDPSKMLPAIDASAYLAQLIFEYDSNIRSCDSILGMASQVFQLVSGLLRYMNTPRRPQRRKT